jgi:hypothetical protein
MWALLPRSTVRRLASTRQGLTLVRCFAWRSRKATLKPVPRPLKCAEFRFWCSPICLLLEPIFGGARAFSTGDFEIVVEETERRDEIGSIARSLLNSATA